MDIDTDINVASRTIKGILYARKHNGLYSSIVTGQRGIGKSSYCIQILYNVFRALGFEQDESWQMAIDRTLYTIPEIINFLDQSTELPDKDLFIWDDAGVFAGGVRWLTNQQEMVLIESICDTLRDSVYGIFLNVPDVRTLSRRLRSYDDYLVKIYRIRNNDKNRELFDDVSDLREARLYKKTVLPSSQIRVYKQYCDTFNIMLPSWVYEIYKKKRHQYTKNNIEHLKKFLEKKDNIN
jgi:hypothetical protein